MISSIFLVRKIFVERRELAKTSEWARVNMNGRFGESRILHETAFASEKIRIYMEL